MIETVVEYCSVTGGRGGDCDTGYKRKVTTVIDRQTGLAIIRQDGIGTFAHREVSERVIGPWPFYTTIHGPYEPFPRLRPEFAELVAAIL